MSLNQSKYLALFNSALNNYTNQSKRVGVVSTFFTKFRHSFTKYSALTQLENSLKKADSNEAQKSIVTQFLTDLKIRNKINNHSFASYLLDVLVSEDKDAQWEQYYANAVVFYKETKMLYRGSNQPPLDAFSNGMKAGNSNNIEDFKYRGGE